ncbi:ABC transporter substrate-binding protein [Methylobacterium oryzihabitans]|uniref:sn-glycerol-3-phosphate-binding periplasmic protein UgpB n=1 Tax=Methylobacterium oryzihabitans TaxID=2499852 RepID=A0A437PFY1_9HYPH|nr:ABC transporter substrate-binding protein [Methylobacterium oryzihabitans]RVU21176.1 ABC transporter substrate-binding protein [Methylobacterium oryzihabitans]
MRRWLAALATGLMLAAAPARAEQTEIVVHYPMPGFFKSVMDTISAEYMRRKPEVRITFAAPSPTYEEGLQLMLRQANSPQMPDVSFVGLNRLRVLAERKVGEDLAPLVAKDAGLTQEGFSDHLLSLARIGDRQVGLAFATSNPIFYYNADLVRKAGGDPDAMPTDWDGIIALAAKIQALGDGTVGMGYRWMLDDWMFSALLFGDGGRMMAPDESRVSFDGPEGLAALRLLDRMVKEGRMPALTGDAMVQTFQAGRMGLFFWTTGALRSILNGVGDKFELRTATLPLLNPDKGRLPTGGNAAVMFTRDPAKQAAVYDFIKFAAGPFGQTVVVPGTGYVPTNDLAPKDERYLKGFYEKNPTYRAGLSQMDRMVPWYAFPGTNGVKITQTIVDTLSRVAEQKATPEQALKDMSAEVTKLLPRR